MGTYRKIADKAGIDEKTVRKITEIADYPQNPETPTATGDAEETGRINQISFISFGCGGKTASGGN